MSNIALGHPNLLKAGDTIGGGSWATAFPSGNAASDDFSAPARSLNALAASTILTRDHGSAVSQRALVLAWHNLSSAAALTWKLGTTAGASDVASLTLNAWQITPVVRSGRRHQAVMVLQRSYSARYSTLEIVDTANTDGYVEVGQMWIGDLIVTTYGAQYGLRHEQQDLSANQRSDGGTLWSTERRVLRGASFVLPNLLEDEGDTMHEMQRVAGTTKRVLYVPDLSSPAKQQRYGGIGTLAELSALEYPYYRAASLALRWTEA